jgi:hypothetical protein
MTGVTTDLKPVDKDSLSKQESVASKAITEKAK